ncbi:MAG: BPL-N domain-containing protein [Pseudomonadota bacterium]
MTEPKAYTRIHHLLREQNGCHIKKDGGQITVSGTAGPETRWLKSLKIGIYAGSGTSHSWLWFVDLFEGLGLVDLVILDEHRLQDQGLADLNILVISGGDTFAVARALGKSGAEAIRAFVDRGGIYAGSCAGAYLPMKSSKTPLDLFNFVDVKITNVTRILPRAEKESLKFCTSYGCDFIFHPVREAVTLETDNGFGPQASRTLTAPMYGGPGMIAPDPGFILARYSGFTDKTSFLVNRSLAEETLVGHAAVVRVPFGQGCFYLFGPHLEHPGFPEANRCVASALVWASGIDPDHTPCRNDREPISGTGGAGNRTRPVQSGFDAATPTSVPDRSTVRTFITGLKRELSNSRIVAAGLEFVPLSWLIGQKRYEPEKIRVFLESMWKRIRPLERYGTLATNPGNMDGMVEAAGQVTRVLRQIKRDADSGQDTLPGAVALFDLLHGLSLDYFNLYFKTVMLFGQR